jgi:uncharacterized membrane protein
MFLEINKANRMKTFKELMICTAMGLCLFMMACALITILAELVTSRPDLLTMLFSVTMVALISLVVYLNRNG